MSATMCLQNNKTSCVLSDVAHPSCSASSKAVHKIVMADAYGYAGGIYARAYTVTRLLYIVTYTPIYMYTYIYIYIYIHILFIDLYIYIFKSSATVGGRISRSLPQAKRQSREPWLTTCWDSKTCVLLSAFAIRLPSTTQTLQTKSFGICAVLWAKRPSVHSSV